MTVSWRWLGGFTVLLTGPAGTLYVDPWRIKEGAPSADVILITNPRVGHASPEDVVRIRGRDAPVAGPAEALGNLRPPLRPLAPGDELRAAGFSIRAVAAANRELEFFPRDRNWLGYRIEAEGRTFFHAGATDRIPENRDVRSDVTFVPVSGRYLMGEAEARELAEETGAATRVALFLVGDRYRAYEGFVVSES